MKERWSDQLKADPSLFLNHSVVDLFRKAAAFDPDKPAVVSETAEYTYAEVEAISNRIARGLVRVGVTPGSIVAICSGRSVESVCAILGIWKTGCCYVYIDSDSPEEYNAHIRRQCSIAFEVTEEFLAQAIAEETPDFFEEVGAPDRLAVIIFTSGSTGAPKGVMLSHRSVTASASNCLLALGIDSSDRFTCYASMMFVAAVNDICASLCIGCTILLVPKGVRKHIADIAQYYMDSRATIAFLPPHMAMKYMDMPQSPYLKLLMVGSEPARNLRKQNYDIINIYASSEGASIISFYRITDARTEYPIGYPMPTYRCYIVDENGKQVAKGEKGELWLSGRQLFDGYLGLDKLNAEKIIPNPFTSDPGFERVFKTADIVYESDDGLIYCGRADHMVKIRGFRIELTGVEEHMLKYPGIREVCCTSFKDSGGTNILFGYYISDREIDHEDFRAFLKSDMPSYMIPTGLVRCEDFPRTPSGKVARRNFTPPPELNDHKLLEKIYR